jgi:TM2 domain-containing membrane protein YozV
MKTKYIAVIILCSAFLWSSEGSCRDLKEKKSILSNNEFSKSLLIKKEKPNTLNASVKPVSRGKAFLLSFLVPGLGEYYAGSPRMAKIFIGTEIAAWTAFFAFRTYGKWRKQDYHNFAISHAGISLAGKDHDYFVNIEHFNNIREYNQKKLQERNINALYPENDKYSWEWDSKKNRLKYEQIRMSSDKAFSNSTLVIGVVVLNHIVSGIDAMRAAVKTNNKRKDSYKMSLYPLPEGGMQISLMKIF